MLTPSYLLHAVEPAEEIAEQLHADIMARIIERILIRFGRGDDYILTATDKWQIETLQQAGFLLEDIQKELAKATGKMQKEIAEAMEDAGVRALEYDDAIYKAAGLNPAPLMQSPYLVRIMQRDYEATLGEWKNFTHISQKAAHNLFVQACDTAYHQAITGALSITQATKEAIEVAANAGVYVEYKNAAGKEIRKDTIETATTRAVRTGISQASGNITDARMEEMEWDIILVSAHLGARVTDAEDYTNHYWWQGKFYSKSGKDERFPPYSVCGFGKVQGIHGANCRHSHGPGDGENNPFDQYDSEENRIQYDLEQKQRKMEARIRDTKRQLMNWKTAIDNAEDTAQKELFEREYEKKASLLKKQNEAYNSFCKDNELKRRDDRIQIAKWDRKQAAAARSAAKKAEESVANEDSPRPIKKETFAVKWDTVQSDNYKTKFQTLSDSSEANQAAVVRAKWALNNRDGSNTEELYALDMRDGTEIARITDQHYPNSVMRTKQFDSKISTAKDNGAKIMLIHNHPSGSPPSVGDFNALLTIQDAYGITVGHDGSVYRYSAPKNKVLQSDFEVAIMNYKRYSYITAHEKALSDIAEKYGFTFERM